MSKKLVTDLFGREITVGDYLLYPVSVGSHSAGIDVGRVLEILKTGRLKVQGAWTSYGRLEKKSKPSILNCPERAVVTTAAYLPEKIHELLGN